MKYKSFFSIAGSGIVICIPYCSKLQSLRQKKQLTRITKCTSQR